MRSENSFKSLEDMISTSIVSLLMACVTGEFERPTHSPYIDREWKQMKHTNPYPDICSEDVYDTKTKLKFCILEHMWIDEMPTDMPRMSPGRYNFGPNYSHILPSRRVEAKGTDCLYKLRGKEPAVPYNCYTPITDNNEYYYLFYNEISRDLRFTFDFVLHEDPQLYIENNFWFLILYLRKIAMELTSPFELLKVLTSSVEYKKNAQAKLADLENQIKFLGYQLEGIIVELQHKTEEAGKSIQTLGASRKLQN